MTRRPTFALLCATAFVTLFVTSIHAQGVGINATGAAADTSAILDLSATNKGLLPPRMTAAQRAAIVLPATGLLVYQTDGSVGLYYNAGTSAAPNWKLVLDSSSAGAQPWSVSGSTINYAPGNVGIQRAAPLARLDVLGGNWDVVGGEGDFRIGDAATRFKIGVATGGGGTGAFSLMGQGPAGAYNVMSLGTQGNKVLHVNGNSQRVGIGTDAPTAPLGFAAAIGKKITLYPGTTGDYGLGISAGRLFIATETAGTDVAIGYDNAGTFNERFAFKTNGAMAVGGNAGSAGQVLQSNGAGASPTWVNPNTTAYNNLYHTDSGTMTIVAAGGTSNLPDMTQTITVASTSKLIISFNLWAMDPSCAFCGGSVAEWTVQVDGANVKFYQLPLDNGGQGSVTPTFVRTVGAGTHTITVNAHAITKSITFGVTNPMFGNTVTVQVVSQ